MALTRRQFCIRTGGAALASTAALGVGIKFLPKNRYRIVLAEGQRLSDGFRKWAGKARFTSPQAAVAAVRGPGVRFSISMDDVPASS